jgi:hypothetical protein
MKIMKLRSLILAGFLALPLTSSYAQVDISVGFAPPPLPVYEQPPCPVEGYLWTPGYWGYGYDVGDYYWVPGAWVAPPSVGVLWTPPWWGWNNGVYAFNQGYWGPTVGFYGGVNYGYGYTGDGYWGGRWQGNNFQYNTAVTRVNKTVINNTYVNNSFTRNVNSNRASFNGPNGVKAQPTAQQKAAAANAKKLPPTSQQLSRQQAAAKDRNLQASVNKGKPNADAVKTFNKNEGVGQGKGGEQAAGAAGGAGAGKAENRPPGAGVERAGNKPGNVTEHNRQGAGAGNKAAGSGNAGGNGNKAKTGNHGNNMRTATGNQAKMHTSKGAVAGGGAAHAPRQMTSRSGPPKTAAHGPPMGARNAQMGGKHPQMGGGGNRPAPKAQQPQGKKKPGQR